MRGEAVRFGVEVDQEGLLDGSEQRLTLHRIDEQAMRLPSRGFHWINEQPYNR